MSYRRVNGAYAKRCTGESGNVVTKNQVEVQKLSEDITKMRTHEYHIELLIEH